MSMRRARDVALALARARDLDLALALDEVRARANLLVSVVSRITAAAASARVDSGTGAGPEAESSRAATWLVARLVRVLPVGDRLRYGEEFAAELERLIEAGVSRRGQLGYALRLGPRMWSLRAALRAAAPVRRRS